MESQQLTLSFYVVKYTVIAAGTAALAGTTLGAVLPWAGALLVPSVPVGEWTGLDRSTQLINLRTPVAATIGLTTAVIKVSFIRDKVCAALC